MAEHAMERLLKPGDRAPNVVLDAINHGGKVAIDDFRGQSPVLVGLYRGLQCPFCRRHMVEVFPQLKKEFLDTGRVAYVHLALPMTGIHPRAFDAAVAADCAAEQGRFWQMHMTLFAGPVELEEESIIRSASTRC